MANKVAANDSLFDVLDESWVEPQAATSKLQPTRDASSSEALVVNAPRAEKLISSSSQWSISSDRASGHATPSSDTARQARLSSSLTSIDVNSLHTRRKGREGSGGTSDSELLIPGPSSPSTRLPSHKRSSSDDLLCDAARARDDYIPKLSPPRTSPLSRNEIAPTSRQAIPPPRIPSTTQDEQYSSINDHDDAAGEDSHDHFGSAREEPSISQACATPEENTFIEHSDAEAFPIPGMPDWKKGLGKAGPTLFQKKPLMIKEMFENRYAEELKDPSRAALQTATMQSDQGVSQEPSGKDSQAGNTPSASGGDGARILGTQALTDTIPRKDASDVVRGASTSSDSAEARETDTLLGQVPQCAFTFASPVEEQVEAFPAVTPSKSHALLRLFPQNASSAAYEQILNTPRSERKNGDAHRLLSTLVEQGERERKRLRVDERVQSRGRSTGAVKSPSPRIDHTPGRRRAQRELVQDRFESTKPSLESLQITSDPSSPYRARHAEKTPASNIFVSDNERQRRSTRYVQSPRKILRLWSAANQVEEEMESERREKEAKEAEEEGDWQDVSDRSPTESTPPPAKIPVVSIDPPTRILLKEPTVTSEGQRQDRMLRILPDDIDSQEMENMAKGRMTFDRAMGKWVPRKLANEGDGGTITDESTDPFRDFESFASQNAKKGNVHAPRSRSALRNEVKLNESTATSMQTELSSTEAPAFLRVPPKTPDPAMQINGSLTPRSILKSAKALMVTPNGDSPIAFRQAPRSISFADGGPRSSADRVEKVEQLLLQLAQLALGPDDSGYDEGEVDDNSVLSQPTPTRRLTYDSSTNLEAGAKSPWNLSILKGAARSLAGRDLGDASFLTNASFNLAHDRILKLLTDVAPWEPGWQELKHIDLSKRRVESVMRIKEYLPSLESAVLDENEISYLTGLPNTLQHLSISANRLPPTVSFGHLINLRTLDVSNNRIDESLMSLQPLVHLQHLRAESNGVCTLEGIQRLSKLESLHLRHNRLQAVNMVSGQWPRLKELILSHNELVTIRGLSHLTQLRCLNLDHNDLTRLDLGVQMPRLKQLRLSGNAHLSKLDVVSATNLSTLYADDCSLQEVMNLDRLHKLDNLSLRQQNGAGYGLNWPAHQTRDIKRLFLSGNAFRTIDLTGKATMMATKFYNMVYLELSACQLTILPLDLPDLVPNLRHLNADYNLFEALPNLSRLRRLKRLSMIGCRISKSRRIVESLSGCEELELLDVRLNPCTMGLYPPILTTTSATVINRAFLPPIPHPAIARPDLVARKEEPEGMAANEKSFFHKRGPGPDISSHLESDKDRRSSGILRDNALFVASDERFIRTLPSQYQLQRLLHRGALAMACPSMTWLDGLLIDEEEVHQANDYFKQRLHRRHDPDQDVVVSSTSSGYSSDR